MRPAAVRGAEPCGEGGQLVRTGDTLWFSPISHFNVSYSDSVTLPGVLRGPEGPQADSLKL